MQKTAYLLIMLAPLTGCTPSAPKTNTVNWDDINYADIVCGKDRANSPACKTKDEDIMAIGRGKGR